MTTIDKYVKEKDKSTFIYKSVDPNRLGVEVYCDDILTPYSFYLVRKLIFSRETNKTSIDKDFWTVILASWKKEAFSSSDEVVLKKIYCHRGNKRLVYTLEIGCKKPIQRKMCESLKQWFDTLEVTTKNREKLKFLMNQEEIEKQLAETSNGIFDLTKKIDYLKNNLTYELVKDENVLERLIVPKNKKQRKKIYQPANWTIFSSFLHTSKQMISYRRKKIISLKELNKLEKQICFYFLEKNAGKNNKKRSNKKQLIMREQLVKKINTVDYVNYLWARLFLDKKEDIFICNHMSCAGLVSSLDDLLKELKIVVRQRSLFGKYVRCLENQLVRLEGYVLLEQYLQKIVIFEKQKAKMMK